MLKRGLPLAQSASSVAPETTFFMEQGNSNFYPTRCQGCYSNWSYYDKNSRWVHLLAVAELDGHLVQVGQGLLLDLDVVGCPPSA